MPASMLVWPGARCWTTTNAIRAAESRWMTASSASRPPADAPIPTTGNRSREGAAPSSEGGDAGGAKALKSDPELRSARDEREAHARGRARVSEREVPAVVLDDSRHRGRRHRPFRRGESPVRRLDVDHDLAFAAPRAHANGRRAARRSLECSEHEKLERAVEAAPMTPNACVIVRVLRGEPLRGPRRSRPRVSKRRFA